MNGKTAKRIRRATSNLPVGVGRAVKKNWAAKPVTERPAMRAHLERMIASPPREHLKAENFIPPRRPKPNAEQPKPKV